MMQMFRENAKREYKEAVHLNDVSEEMQAWVLNQCDMARHYGMGTTFSRHLKKGRLMRLGEFVRALLWVFSHLQTPEQRLKCWHNVGTLLFCNTKENRLFGIEPFDCHLDEIQERIIEKEVQRRVAQTLRLQELIRENKDLK